MKRREFLSRSATAGLSLGVLSACGGGGGGGDSSTPGSSDPRQPGGATPNTPEMPAYGGPDPFQHGVASGDPLANQVILWTRITAAGLDEIPVIVEVARDADFATPVYQGVGYARSQNDFTVKLDPLLPDPETTYFYRFRSLGFTSPVGRTRTAPTPGAQVDHLRLAVMSCSNLPYGWFNAYARVARRADLDAVLHLGDYIYEYAQGEYNDPDLADLRPVDPPHEIIALDDYRRRYACYRRDPDLQECHRQHPFICVWDDHEIANDTWMNGAENHNEGEGDFADRKRAAVRAYYEWMPIRMGFPDRDMRIYRRFDYGDLLTLMMLDTRLIGRDQQVDKPSDARDRNRQLLGQDQREWLFEQLEYSQGRGARWHLIGQQVMLSPLTVGTLPDMPNWDLGGGAPLNYDQWDGYQTSRRALLGRIEAMALNNTVVLTGDIHSSWAMDVSTDPGNPAVYNRFTGAGAVAVEFVTPAVTSPAAPSKALSDLARAALVPLNPHLKWVDLFRRGYLVLDLTAEHCKADWFHLNTVSEPDDSEFFARSYLTRDGQNHLEQSSVPSAPKTDAPPLAPATQRIKP